ncbi:hypothetical protein [Legionella sp. CNM-4043-24]|uniref:hypothetical protein n=1 Tax=Legionella sp. CNM-4043-24 TaxID=3421646 RepID=UPI00403A9E65
MSSSSTELKRLTSTDVNIAFDALFGTQLPDINFENQGIDVAIATVDNVSRFVYRTQKYPGFLLQYWAKQSGEDKLIIVTSPYADLSVSQKGTFAYLLNEEDIKSILASQQTLHPTKTIHLIAPRIEASIREDHIVIDYSISPPNQVDEDGFTLLSNNKKSRLIIDSKSYPPLFVPYPDIERLCLGNQSLTNSTDCGLHVIHTVPRLISLIENNQEITPDALPASALIPEITIDRLRELQAGYQRRVENNENHRYTTLGIFKGGVRPSVKLSAVNKLIKNIQENQDDVLKELDAREREAVKQGTLSKIVNRYLSHRPAPYSAQPVQP